MSDAPILLTDEAMQGFVREGYVTVQSSLPKSYHDAMYARLEPLEEDGLVGHNNLLPMVPELGELLDEPVVRGALLSTPGPVRVEEGNTTAGWVAAAGCDRRDMRPTPPSDVRRRMDKSRAACTKRPPGAREVRRRT